MPCLPLSLSNNNGMESVLDLLAMLMSWNEVWSRLDLDMSWKELWFRVDLVISMNGICGHHWDAQRGECYRG